jgi:hypothetical protein
MLQGVRNVTQTEEQENKPIKPWPKVRALKDYEWKQDTDEAIQDKSRHRQIPAFLAKIEKDAEVYSYMKPDIELRLVYDEAIFQEEGGTKEFKVSRRLVKQIKIGDHVLLDVGGCCTILFPPKLVRERT